MHKSETQPLCRYCGAMIRKHSITVCVKTERSDNHRPNDGWSRYAYVDVPVKTKAECQKLTNHSVLSVKWDRVTKSTETGYERFPDQDHIGQFTEWDGESYVDPFGDVTLGDPSPKGYAK